ncbi:hypothetical protein OG819_55695 [Streptomyces sp. NBC_01549]|uniref:hypothetical protein n=1 Tax=Streptomyces sp. NBC_01549 TaxID=2975874 RepID=UPI0022500AB0|nr:hypothetical protein [Streptomyces sp. NBC_01549]MCX4598400.1 hypothetical protein [Streptomyces sp. NBC_01549]
MTKENALRSYGAAALAHERMTADGTVEPGWSGPADVQSSFASWYGSATRLGATAEELGNAVEVARAERKADLIERENEVRAQDAARADLLSDVATAIDYDPDVAPW